MFTTTSETNVLLLVPFDFPAIFQLYDSGGFHHTVFSVASWVIISMYWMIVLILRLIHIDEKKM